MGGGLYWTLTLSARQTSAVFPSWVMMHKSLLHLWNRERVFEFRSRYLRVQLKATTLITTLGGCIAGLVWIHCEKDSGGGNPRLPPRRPRFKGVVYIEGRSRNGGSQVLMLVTDAHRKLCFNGPNVWSFQKTQHILFGYVEFRNRDNFSEWSFPEGLIMKTINVPV